MAAAVLLARQSLSRRVVALSSPGATAAVRVRLWFMHARIRQSVNHRPPPPRNLSQRQLQPQSSRAASSWTRAGSQSSPNAAGRTAAGSAAVFLLMAAGVAAARPAEEGEGPALCGPSKVAHTLYVTGSAR